jgi:hypothetical protein
VDPVAALLSAGLVPGTALPPTSRYATVGTRVHTPAAAPGAPQEQPAPIAHLGRRLVPRPDRLAASQEVVCTQGDRRDTLAAAVYGDPLLWWRLADGNGVIDPATMAVPPGRVLRVTAGEGVPGG